MGEETIEKVMSEVNNWSVEDIRELADQCSNLADCIESDKEKEV